MQTSTITDKAAVTTHNSNVRSLESAVMLAIADGHAPKDGEKLVKDEASSDFEKAVAKYLKEDPDYGAVKAMLSKIDENYGNDDAGYTVEVTDGEWNIAPGEVELGDDGMPKLKGSE